MQVSHLLVDAAALLDTHTTSTTTTTTPACHTCCSAQLVAQVVHLTLQLSQQFLLYKQVTWGKAVPKTHPSE